MRRSRDICGDAQSAHLAQCSATQASGPTRISRRSLPCKALVTPSAQRVAEWKKKTE